MVISVQRSIRVSKKSSVLFFSSPPPPPLFFLKSSRRDELGLTSKLESVNHGPMDMSLLIVWIFV